MTMSLIKRCFVVNRQVFRNSPRYEIWKFSRFRPQMRFLIQIVETIIQNHRTFLNRKFHSLLTASFFSDSLHPFFIISWFIRPPVSIFSSFSWYLTDISPAENWLWSEIKTKAVIWHYFWMAKGNLG